MTSVGELLSVDCVHTHNQCKCFASKKCHKFYKLYDKLLSLNEFRILMRNAVACRRD